eukprot:scaffold276520_cov22-Prasinocladus_malaysianus.AAC.1
MDDPVILNRYQMVANPAIMCTKASDNPSVYKYASRPQRDVICCVLENCGACSTPPHAAIEASYDR